MRGTGMALVAPTVRGSRPALAALALCACLLTAVHGPPAGADGNEAPGSPAVAAAVSAGRAHTCAIGPQSHLSCWGENAHGQLGLGDTENRGD
ncbi:MAG: hypothetical protein KDB35_19785, partial [Acidimicrobiales bacterium]|nr:hypothetical protein [Acidimicrobiales bacterium]